MRTIITHRLGWRQRFSTTPLFKTVSYKHPFAHHGRFFSDSSRPLIYPDPINSEHYDLASYAAYAARTGLDVKSKVYVGTQYEYTVADSLRTLGFDLKRVGGRSDCGIDLLGTWRVPYYSVSDHSLRVIVQCKASAKIGPHHIRELEGAFVGAPPGWRNGPGLLAFLVSQRPATKGVRDAMAGSSWPMGYALCSQDGKLEQILWNGKAEQEELEGIGVSVGFSDDTTGEVEKRLVLTWKGTPYSLGPASNESVSAGL
ncbi:hypothetical protein F5Y11DRAFT_282136 [Daldinia sp. FL1419]|nr:hypothetical protein F5Y11DRAFT_282136 [Daldinia sp. FL1419]